MKLKIFFLVIILVQPSYLFSQTDFNGLVLIEKVTKAENENGIKIQFQLKEPLEHSPDREIKSDRIVFLFRNTYIITPKMSIQLDSPIFSEIKVVQFDSKTVRSVIYCKGLVPKGMKPEISLDNKLLCIISITYPVTPTLTNTTQPTAKMIAKTPQESSKTDVNPENNVLKKELSSPTQIQSPFSQANGKESEGTYLNLGEEDDKPQPTDSSTSSYDDSMTKSLFKSFTSLLFILGLIVLTVYLLKRFFFQKGELGGQGKSMKLLSSIYIGEKKRICLVETLGKILVLGITPNNINLLTEIEGDKIMDIVSELQKDVQKPKPFKNIIKDSSDNFDTDKIDSKAKNLSKILKNLLSRDN